MGLNLGKQLFHAAAIIATACMPVAAAHAQTSVAQFTADNSALLKSASITADVAALVAADGSTVAALIALAKSSSDEDKKRGIATGLAQAAKNAQERNAAVARAIREGITASDDKTLISFFTDAAKVADNAVPNLISAGTTGLGPLPIGGVNGGALVSPSFGIATSPYGLTGGTGAIFGGSSSPLGTVTNGSVSP